MFEQMLKTFWQHFWEIRGEILETINNLEEKYLK